MPRGNGNPSPKRKRKMSDPLAGATPTYRGTTSRVGNSCKVVVFGGLLLVCSVVVLFWTEHEGVSLRRSLHHGAQTVSEANADSVDLKNAHRLVHLVGTATSTETLTDSSLGISAASGVLKLRRFAEMYQWEEDEQTRAYSKDWESLVIDSDDFDVQDSHENPSFMAYSSQVFQPDTVALGAFTLSPDITQRINWYTQMEDSISLDKIQDENIRSKAVIGGSNQLYIRKNSQNNNDPSQDPQVGDSRITFQVVQPQTISIIAQQIDETLVPFQQRAHGRTILLVEQGTRTAREMFQNAAADSSSNAALIRFFCFLMMYFGLVILAKPLSIFENLIPKITDLTGEHGQTSTAALSMAPVSAVLCLAVIALSWLFYTPILSTFALALVGFAVFYLGRHLNLWGLDPESAANLEQYMELQQSMV